MILTLLSVLRSIKINHLFSNRPSGSRKDFTFFTEQTTGHKQLTDHADRSSPAALVTIPTNHISQ